jgi:hypothetical protein
MLERDHYRVMAQFSAPLQGASAVVLSDPGAARYALAPGYLLPRLRRSLKIRPLVRVIQSCAARSPLATFSRARGAR